MNTFLTSIVLGIIVYAVIYLFKKKKTEMFEEDSVFKVENKTETEESSLVQVFSGDEHQVVHLKAILEENEIAAMIQNDFQSGVIAGFSAGSSSAIDLFIQEKDLEKAKGIINDFNKS